MKTLNLNKIPAKKVTCLKDLSPIQMAANLFHNGWKIFFENGTLKAKKRGQKKITIYYRGMGVC